MTRSSVRRFACSSADRNSASLNGGRVVRGSTCERVMSCSDISMRGRSRVARIYSNIYLNMAGLLSGFNANACRWTLYIIFEESGNRVASAHFGDETRTMKTKQDDFAEWV